MSSAGFSGLEPPACLDGAGILRRRRNDLGDELDHGVYALLTLHRWPDRIALVLVTRRQSRPRSHFADEWNEVSAREASRPADAANHADHRSSTHEYRTGSTTNVRIVDVTSPPITTVASGR